MGINFDKEVEQANKEIKEVQVRFKRKDQKKRITTHVRISPYLRDCLRNEAKQSNRSLSKLMDRIVTLYFKHNKSFEEEML